MSWQNSAEIVFLGDPGNFKIRAYPVFFDTEFTHLAVDAELISIAFVTLEGQELYIEVDFDPGRCSPWVQRNVLPKLRRKEKLTLPAARRRICEFLSKCPHPVALVGSNPAFDWLFLHKIFDNRLPEFVVNHVFDVNSMLMCYNISKRDMQKQIAKRFQFRKHHALEDAKYARRVYIELRGFEWVKV